MSSEAEASEALFSITLDMVPHLMSDGERCYTGDTAIALDDWRDALGAYVQHIERRVLAQQPCQMCHELPCDGVKHRMFRCCNQKEPRDRCDPCIARQAQETSG